MKDDKLERTRAVARASRVDPQGRSSSPEAAMSQAIVLQVVAGPDAGLRQTISESPALIGRSPQAHLRLSDPTVSSFHCELRWNDREIEVRDLESMNGIRYAGARFLRAYFPAGSAIELGGSMIKITLDQVGHVPQQERNFFGELRGESPQMRELFGLLARLARTDLSVLIDGPTGTGKDVAARSLHRESRRAAGPFIVLDCTSVPASLAESTLFGHEKGAFTGAIDRKIGVFEAAEGGTLFLDEIGELPLDLQPKLLRALETRTITRVGSTQPRPVNLRLISATWRDLRALINQQKFREDLYYRLAQARIAIPPLDERPEDVPVLIEYFLARLQQRPKNADVHEQGPSIASAISADALSELSARRFPGNVRELRSTVERAALMAEGAIITASDLAFERLLSTERDRGRSPEFFDRGRTLELEGDGAVEPSRADSREPGSFKDEKRTVLEEFEKAYLVRLLAKTNGNLSRAAAVAEVERHHLRTLLKKHGLHGEAT